MKNQQLFLDLYERRGHKASCSSQDCRVWRIEGVTAYWTEIHKQKLPREPMLELGEPEL